MSWQLGLILVCAWLVVIYLILAVFSFSKRDDAEWRDFSEHQWKDLRRMDFRRRMDERARKTRAGIR